MKSRKKGRPASDSRILVVDDEPDMLTNYKRLLQRAGHDCLTTTDPTQVPKLLGDYQPDLVLTDLMMPNGSGIEVLKQARGYDPGIPVILVTAYGSIDSAVEAMKLSAADYITKPFSVEELLGKIQEALSRRLVERGEARLDPREKGSRAWRQEIIGISPSLERVMELVQKVARTDVNVLIDGESGTGKELVARAIHKLSQRRDEIFVPVDCASLPENLLESEIFGYRKGAFTGATSDKMGLFEFAHKGTLFLDEIGEMPISLQAKLLRVLQQRQFRPIGGREEIEIDVRVVAATNRDLNQALREKTFRSDLYYRLNVVTIHLPPLRDRLEDIPLLSNHFLTQFARSEHLSTKTLSAEALECLRRYRWPGNIREVQNVIERSATLAGGELIEVGDLPENLRSTDEEDEGFGASKGPLFSVKNQMVGDFE
ncbi:MAG: sigma-54 dependent transcriptional regulator, partial [bacterium]